MERPPRTDTRPTSSEDEPGPTKQQFLGIRGKTPSPPWKNRVIVVDPDRGTVEVQNEKSIAQGTQNDSSVRLLAKLKVWRFLDDYTRVKLPPRKTEVTLFVDPETESKPTTKNATDDGHSNVMLMKLYLDRLPLGALNQILRLLGKLSTLYVLKSKPWSETSSHISATHAMNGIVEQH